MISHRILRLIFRKTSVLFLHHIYINCIVSKDKKDKNDILKCIYTIVKCLNVK